MKSWGSVPAMCVLTVLFWAACRSDSQEAASPNTQQARTFTSPTFLPVEGASLDTLRAAGESWPVHGGSYFNQRYSALDQVQRANVHQLVPAWIHQTGVTESFQTTPIVVGNIMYATTAESRVIALDAGTGELLWRFTPLISSVSLCCGPNNRGVAVYGQNVYVATLDANLIALDQRTGQVVWQTNVADPEDGYSITMAPLAYDGRVFVGVSGGKFGIRGFVAAFDAESGEQAWVWNTIPAPEEAPNGWWGDWRDADPYGTALNRDLVLEREDSITYPDAWRRGGGPVWMTPAYDPSSKTLYFSVGNPAPPLNGQVRPGDNLYTGSLVALDAVNGTLKWYFQYLPHDVWDLSPGSAPFLFSVGGRRLVGHAGKTGWLYVVDADSGEPVLRSENFVPQDALFAAPAPDGVRIVPGSNGGTSWSPVAYSPRTGLAYVPATHQPMIVARTSQPRGEPGSLWLGGTFRFSPDDQTWGTLSAIDLSDGGIRWQRRTSAPLVGPVLATAGDLVFVGQGSGTFDAFDAIDGTLLWQFRTGAGVHGGPVTYTVNGVQYVAIAAGGDYQTDSPRGDAIIAFALAGSPRPAPAQYESPQYSRTSAIRYGEVRQVPAAEVERMRAPAQQTTTQD